MLFDPAYWRSVINFDALVEAGMISEADVRLMIFAETPEQAWELLRQHVGVADGVAAAHHFSPPIQP